MKQELREVFAAAKADNNRGLAPSEIAAVIRNAPEEMRGKIAGVVNAVQPATREGRDALNMALSAPSEVRALVEKINRLGDDVHTRQGMHALKQYEALASELFSTAANRDIPDASKGKRIRELNDEMAILMDEARDWVERSEREAEARALGKKLGRLGMAPRNATGGGEWRGLLPSLSEYRVLQEAVPGDGGYLVPSGVSSTYIDRLTAQSAFLKGIPAANMIKFEGGSFSLPQLQSWSAAGFVDEGDPIAAGSAVFDAKPFTPHKIADLAWASSEVLEDSAVDLRNVIAEQLLRNVSLKLDSAAFNGGPSDEIKGLIVQGTTTNLTAGNTAITYDHLADACAAIEGTNAVPTVVWCSPDIAAGLRKAKASTAGTYLGGTPTDGPANTAWGLPILASSLIPARTAIVADASRIYLGIRRAATLAISQDARFGEDLVGFRVTARFAGIVVAEATSVQVIKASAS